MERVLPEARTRPADRWACVQGAGPGLSPTRASTARCSTAPSWTCSTTSTACGGCPLSQRVARPGAGAARTPRPRADPAVARTRCPPTAQRAARAGRRRARADSRHPGDIDHADGGLRTRRLRADHEGAQQRAEEGAEERHQDEYARPHAPWTPIRARRFRRVCSQSAITVRLPRHPLQGRAAVTGALQLVAL